MKWLHVGVVVVIMTALLTQPVKAQVTGEEWRRLGDDAMGRAAAPFLHTEEGSRSLTLLLHLGDEGLQVVAHRVFSQNRLVCEARIISVHREQVGGQSVEVPYDAWVAW